MGFTGESFTGQFSKRLFTLAQQNAATQENNCECGLCISTRVETALINVSVVCSEPARSGERQAECHCTRSSGSLSATSV